MMFARDRLRDQMFDFAKLLRCVSFGYALIATRRLRRGIALPIGKSHTAQRP